MELGRHSLALALVTSVFAAPVGVDAQPNIPRIGFLASASGERIKSRIDAFRQGLAQLGYVEGKNIVIEYRSAAGKFEQLPDLAAELVRSKVDVLVVESAPAARAAKNATTVIPIVVGSIADPVGTGLVASLARPGGNITGLSDFNVNLVTKRLELLMELVPTAPRVAVLLNPANPSNALQFKEIHAAAAARAVALISLEAKGPDEIDHAFMALRDRRAGALLVLGDPMFGTHSRRIADLAAKNRVPAIYTASEYADAGGLMSYGANRAESYRRAANFVHKILNGAKAGELPMEQPMTFELVINMKAAKHADITIPPAVLRRADRVIQ